MPSTLSPLGRARPNQHLLRVVNVAVINEDIGPSWDNLQVTRGRREITRVMGKNLSRITLLKVDRKSLARVVHLILVLPRVVMG